MAVARSTALYRLFVSRQQKAAARKHTGGARSLVDPSYTRYAYKNGCAAPSLLLLLLLYHLLQAVGATSAITQHPSLSPPPSILRIELDAVRGTHFSSSSFLPPFFFIVVGKEEEEEDEDFKENPRRSNTITHPRKLDSIRSSRGWDGTRRDAEFRSVPVTLLNY